MRQYVSFDTCRSCARYARLVFLTTFLLVAFTGLSVVRAGDSVDELWKTLNDEEIKKDPFEQQKREVAIHKLARKDSVDAAKCLVRVLDDPFEHIQEEAILWMQQEFSNKDTVKWLARRATKARNPSIRANVIRTLGGLNKTFVAEELKARTKDPSPVVRKQTVRALGKLSLDQAPDYLIRMLEDDDRSVRIAAARAIGNVGSADVLSELRKKTGASRKKERAELCLALGKIGGPEIISFLKNYSDDPDWRVRVMTLRGIFHAENEVEQRTETIKVAKQALSDDNWHVVVAAIDVLVRVWQTDVIPILINNFENTNGRIVVDYTRALRALTGQDIGPDPLAWKGWWEAHGGPDFELGDRPENWRKRPEKNQNEHDTQTFFNIPLDSKRIAFVMDFSGGMDNPAGGGNNGNPGGETKIERAKKELLRTIKKMKREHQFNVIIYRYYSSFPPKTEVQSPFGPRLLPATKNAKRKVDHWLSKQEATGWGAFYEAFSTAARIPDVDTIIFLSDGVPTRGKHACITKAGRKHFFRSLKRENRYRQIMIHTVLTGEKGTDRDFMKKIADVTGGYFDHR